MIIYYEKNTGRIIGFQSGRVHNKIQIDSYIDDGIGKENIGKFIIGWEETDEIELFEEENEKFVELPGGLFKKEKIKTISQRTKKIEHNIDKFDMLKKFEDITSFSPLDCKIDIENNSIISK